MIGQTISHYKILEKLGGGGMGVVYKAEDTKLKRLVALKFLPPDLTRDEEAKERFVHEAQAASALDHPNICVIHEIDETEDGRIFICMAYYEGETLKKRIAKGEERGEKGEERAAPIAPRSSPFVMAGGLSVVSVIDFAIQTAQGLSRAHEAGITHRDIKPANIMVTNRGEVKIVDFGLAKLVGAVGLTKAGSTLGTPAYMSPEQTRGEEVDGRTDIWSLGVVLYEMLTGQFPFKGEYEQAVVYSILHEAPKPLISMRQDTPMELQSIVTKALTKDREERYQHVEEMLADLKHISSDSESRPVGTTKSRMPNRQRVFLYGSIATLLILLVVGRFYFFSERSETIDAIAVLPLANLSGDPNKESFADGMTEALISDLGQIEALRVISRTSVMQYKNFMKPLPEIAKELNVDVIVEGSVLSSGNRVEINVRLIEAATEQRRWAKNYARELRDALTLQREVALAIAREIKVQVTPHAQARLEEARVVDPEVYELYLWGKKFRDKETRESLQQAVKYFEQAIAKDPNFAAAYAELVVPYFLFGSLGVISQEEAKSKARKAAAKALELDRTIAEAHTALGVIREFYDWDWSGAEEAFKQAIALNPSSREAHREYGLLLSRMGRTQEGLAEMKRAQEVDPLSEIANAYVAWAYIYNRQYDAALEQCRKALVLNPSSGQTHFMFGEAYLHKGMYKEAIAALETEAVTSLGRPDAFAYLGCAYALSGNREKALKMLDELKEQYKKRGVNANVSVPIAQIYTGLGKKDEALTWLERDYENRYANLVIHLILNPIFDPLHSEPRFQALLKKMGLGK